MRTVFITLLAPLWLGLLGLSGPAFSAPRELGAALALPYFSGDGEATEITIAHRADANRTLSIVIFDGASPDWQAVDFSCDLFSRGSTSLRLTPSGGNTLVEFSCVDLTTGNPIPRLLITVGSQGLVWVTVRDPATGDTLGEDVLFGSSRVTNTDAGSTFTVEAAAFRAGSGANDGNQVFTLDGVEYQRPPSILRTSFRAEDASIRSSLLLAVVDGRVGVAQPARVDMIFYDETARAFSARFDFDCFAKIPLTDIDPRFDRAFLGSDVGFLEMTSSARPPDAKIVGIVGWIVEELVDGGQLDPAGPAMTSASASARPLRWSDNPLVVDTAELELR